MLNIYKEWWNKNKWNSLKSHNNTLFIRKITMCRSLGILIHWNHYTIQCTTLNTMLTFIIKVVNNWKLIWTALDLRREQVKMGFNLWYTTLAVLRLVLISYLIISNKNNLNMVKASAIWSLAFLVDYLLLVSMLMQLIYKLWKIL